jgi:hypothetical protein
MLGSACLFSVATGEMEAGPELTRDCEMFWLPIRLQNHLVFLSSAVLESLFQSAKIQLYQSVYKSLLAKTLYFQRFLTTAFTSGSAAKSYCLIIEITP